MVVILLYVVGIGFILYLFGSFLLPILIGLAIWAHQTVWMICLSLVWCGWFLVQPRQALNSVREAQGKPPLPEPPGRPRKAAEVASEARGAYASPAPLRGRWSPSRHEGPPFLGSDDPAQTGTSDHHGPPGGRRPMRDGRLRPRGSVCSSSAQAQAEFVGIVRYVGDGDSLCIGGTSDPANWIEVRLVNFYAPELGEPDGRAAKRALEQLAIGRTLHCMADHRPYNRVVATCRLGGRDLGVLMRERGIREGGRGR